jgi:hypothetical protein
MSENIVAYFPQVGDRVYVRKGAGEDDNIYGIVTSNTERCRLEGCGGYRIRVKWKDGRITKPCSNATHIEGENAWRIG